MARAEERLSVGVIARPDDEQARRAARYVGRRVPAREDRGVLLAMLGLDDDNATPVSSAPPACPERHETRPADNEASRPAQTHTGRRTREDDGDWRHRAICRDEDPELFFPVGNSGPALLQIAEATTVCRRCPVIADCLAWALDNGQDSGVAGGLSEDERRSLKRRTARRRAGN